MPARHDFVVRRQRPRTIDSRVWATASTIAALTAGWIVIDVITFSSDVWALLAGERLLTSLVLALRGIMPLDERRGPLVEARAFGVLLIILGFFLATSYTLAATRASMDSLAAVSAYVHLPFLIAAGIGLFPLVAFEGLLVTALVVGTTMLVPNALPVSGTPWATNVGLLWLLVTICGVATLGGMQ